jgi:hypothetical protein
LMCMAAAAMFHYSALIFLPLYFLNPKKLNINLYLLVLIIPMLFTLTNFSLHPVFTLLGQDNPLTQRYYIYNDFYTGLSSQGVGEQTNLFNVYILFYIALGVLFVLKWSLICSYNKYAVVIIKIHIYSIALFYLFYNFVAFRFMEILNVVLVISIPFVIHMFREKRVAAMGVIICSLAFLTFSIYHTHLLEPYLK